MPAQVSATVVKLIAQAEARAVEHDHAAPRELPEKRRPCRCDRAIARNEQQRAALAALQHTHPQPGLAKLQVTRRDGNAVTLPHPFLSTLEVSNAGAHASTFRSVSGSGPRIAETFRRT